MGIEIVGELAEKWGAEKKIGICLRGNRLLPNSPPKAHTLVHQFLTQRKVNIHYNSPFNESFEKDNDYELVI